MRGTELGRFVLCLPNVTSFIKTHLELTDEVTSFIGALEVTKEIFSFMSQSYIEMTHEEYEISLEDFKKNLEVFYNHGKKTFLQENESFYMHCLRFYVPRLAEKTFRKHQLGIGIFNMQGFERRNKESKNTLKRFSTMNRDGVNILLNNLKRLLRVFLYNTNAY